MSNEFNFDVTGFRDMGVRIDDYCGEWSIEPTRFNQSLSMVSRLNLREHVQQNVEAGMKTADLHAESFVRAGDGGNIAIVRIRGVMTKSGSSLDVSGSTVLARRAVRNAANDDTVSGILLYIDSPGGTVAGTQDLADDVHNAAQQKLVYTVFEDIGASAAYWVGSQASKVFAANRTTLVGSIGTFMGLYDFSKNAEKEGVKAILIKAGEFKGAGFDGTEVSEEQIAEWQKVVDKQQAEFTAGVMRGRSMDKATANDLVTGLVYQAADAKKLGLIDGIQSLDQTLQQLQRDSRKAKQPRSVSVSETTTQPTAASYREIVAACPGIDQSSAEDCQFIADCQRRELTASESSKEWGETQAARIATARQEAEAARKEAEELKAKEAEKKPAAKGLPTVGTRTGKERANVGSATEEFKAVIDANLAKGMSRTDAVIKANRTHPELRQQMVDEANGRAA